MAFLDKLDGFYGTGERNRAGESLEEFLAGYNPKKYDSPSNTTDMVVVRCREKLVSWGQPLEVLLVKRSNHPSIGMWATPGGFVEMREDLEAGAARELEEETGVRGLPLQQLRTWGNYDRDPRWRVITTSFLALVEGDVPVKAGDDAADALWMQVSLELEKSKTEAAKVDSSDGVPASGLAAADHTEEIWNLRLKNQPRGILAGARVQITRSIHPLLPQEKFQLLESDGLAVDHGCIITHALLYLKSQLERN